MPSLKKLADMAELSVHDKTSKKRMKEIFSVFKENHVEKGLTPDKAVKILEELGPTFVKIGQMSSTRSDVLPEEYCKAFEKLHADVTPLAFDTVIECINKSYGHNWSDTFLAIDPEPMGSASIAQVHRAVLHDGSVVAVKVRRPGIVEEMREDFVLINRVLATAEFLTVKHETVLMNIDTMVEELQKTSEKELNFKIELENLIRFYDYYANEYGISSPRPYPQFSNESVLVMEYVEGIRIDDVAALEAEHVDIDRLADRVLQNYIHQVIDKGFYHADPHAGNIIIRQNQIVWVDLGMVGELTATQRNLVRRLFRSMVIQDPYELMVSTTGLCRTNTNINQSLLIESLGVWLDKYATASLADVDMGSIFNDLIEMLKEQQLVILPEVTMLVRSVVTIEGLIKEISPKTGVMEIVSQYVVKSSLDPDNLSREAVKLGFTMVDSAEAMAKIPLQVSNSIDMLERGELSVQGDVRIPENTLTAFSSALGILSLALISAGLFIGSSFICFTNMKPQIFEVPLLGFLGFIGAFVLGVYVIWQVIKSFRKLHNKD